ncbi:MAG: hypothetical protein P8171_12235 [Candidatus Thiodiazotropha sp.]|jgi:hypothetical protein
MAGYRTQGYDFVFEISEERINQYIGGSLPGLLSGRSGEIADTEVSGSFAFASPDATESADVRFDAPGENTAYLNIPFRFSADLERPPEWPETVDQTGRVRILTPVIAIESTRTTAQVGFDFRGLAGADVRVTLDSPVDAEWVAYTEPLSRLIEGIVAQTLVAQDWYAVPVSLDIDPDNDGSDPFMPLRLELRVLNDAEPRSVMLLFPTSPHNEATPGDISESVLDPSWDSVCVVGNELLLRRLVGAALLEGMGVYDPLAPDPIVTLNDLLDYADNHVSLSSRVDLGHMIDEWWTSKTDLTQLDISIDASETLDVNASILTGGPFISATMTLHMTAVMEISGTSQFILHWHFDEPEVVVVPGPLVWLLFGPLAPIISALKGVATEFIFSALENVLTSECHLVGFDEWPEEAQPVDIDCSFAFPYPIPLLVDEIVLDDWAMVGSADLPDTTYSAPQPSIQIIGDWLAGDGEFGGATERGLGGGVSMTCFNHYLRHSGSFRAMPAGPVVYPIDYEWCLGGMPMSGTGTLRIGDANVHYEATGERLSMELELGDSLESELCVSALDQRGTELFTERAFSVEGEERFCAFEGVEQLEGPPAELEQAGAFTEGLPLTQGYRATSEEVSFGEYDGMMRNALVRGMGVDPRSASVRRP